MFPVHKEKRPCEICGSLMDGYKYLVFQIFNADNGSDIINQDICDSCNLRIAKFVNSLKLEYKEKNDK